ncbi:class I SAM-dependent methyltransferase [Candidatus Poriferisodalis multihospitum]|uniref:class I SAM-dependent methyltransferase n=1 Tax=Candidatus Poriferisodalis multihospitum TaxID=2983191 RepID=UPI0023A76162|nr:methyltransferase domain-containing protein [Candidatus Poriferisodalis multihospitum]MDE0319254.1 methyltransferase domain-containing protein [Acidimicrobiaceae bacterium]
MTDRHQAFNELAGAYSRARPGYPESLWVALREALDGRSVPQLAVDVGSGTGIATRQLALILPEWRIVGVEPGEAMRAQAVSDSRDSAVEFRAGSAEDLPLQESSAGLVIAAQALHWFDHPRFYIESRRVLAPGGVIGIIQNDRALEELPLFEDYESFLEEHSPGYTRDYRSFDVVAELAEAGLDDVSRNATEWTRPLTHEQFIGLARSSSKMHAAVQHLGEEETSRRLRALLERHHPSGQLEIPYISTLFTAQRS